MATRASSANKEEIVKSSEKRLRELIPDVKTELKDSIDGIKQDISDLKTKVDSVEHDVSVHDGELTKLRAEMAAIKQSHLERQSILKDIHDRKTNILFYGLPERPNENRENTLKVFFIDKLKFSQDRVDTMLIKTAHRLPKSEYQRQHKPTAPPSIIATFVKMTDRDDLLRARKILREQTERYSIQTDLPQILKKRRAILSRQATEIREKQNVWTMVRVVGVEVVLKTKEPHT